jgi:hypothetical protein
MALRGQVLPNNSPNSGPETRLVNAVVLFTALGKVALGKVALGRIAYIIHFVLASIAEIIRRSCSVITIALATL